MPKYVVTARELRWNGKPYLRDEEFPVSGERETKQADLLVRVGKAAIAPRRAPVRKVATTAPAKAPRKQATRPYNTRRLTAED